jgi:hypothetical protein
LTQDFLEQVDDNSKVLFVPLNVDR